jgi:integrase
MPLAELARQLSERDVLAAMTNEQASDYAAAVQALAPFNLALPATASTVVECLKLVGDLPNLHAAAKFYAARHKRTERKPVADVVAELLSVKGKRGASVRYLQDLRLRLTRFAEAFRKDACNVPTAEIQAWLESEKLAPQSYANFLRVLHLLFEFAVARGYAADNPAASVENVKVNGSDVDIFTPTEMARLLAAASPEFLPCLALGAFAGLRSAEIERLEWSDIDLAGRNIVIGASRPRPPPAASCLLPIIWPRGSRPTSNGKARCGEAPTTISTGRSKRPPPPQPSKRTRRRARAHSRTCGGRRTPCATPTPATASHRPATLGVWQASLAIPPPWSTGTTASL